MNKKFLLKNSIAMLLCVFMTFTALFPVGVVESSASKAEPGNVFGNIFNNGDSITANSMDAGIWTNTGGMSVTEEGRGKGGEALRVELAEGQADVAGFTAIPFEAGIEYNIKVLARAAKADALTGPMRPKKGDDHETSKNKLSFQYESATETAEGYINDRYNMYITDTDWKWYEINFTTPDDMGGVGFAGGLGGLVVALRHSTVWIDQIIVEDVASGKNIFNDGDSNAASANWNSWSGSVFIPSYEGSIVPTRTLYLEPNSSPTSRIALEPNKTYGVFVLARSENESGGSTITLNFGNDEYDIPIKNTDWVWCSEMFSTPSEVTEPTIVLQSKDSGLWVEELVIYDINPGARPVNLTLDPKTTHQTIEGFGFFGSKAVWWSGPDPNTYYDEEWIDTILLDLGITMWRNEVYPYIPPTSNSDSDKTPQNQDSSWPVQKHMVKALNDRAVELNIPLKIILTAWTPPGQWKTNEDTKNGGQLKPEHFEDYGNWWVQVIDMYKEIGVSVYAVSLQNEPYFEQTYNSAKYTAAEYTEMFKNVAPIIKAAYPDVLMFGAETMLEQEHDSFREDIEFHKAILADEKASANIDVFAVHGYSDGVSATGIGSHKRLWEAEKALTAPKPRWMTETSGYGYNWIDEDGRPGALNLGAAIQSALLYGDLSAWVFWQGHVTGNGGEYDLFAPGSGPKKFAASKQFYKYIRPGAVRIDSQVKGVEFESDLIVTAYTHDEENSTVITLVNTSEYDHEVNINGIEGLEYKYYITTGDEDVNCELTGIVKNDILIPAYSIVTLVSDDEPTDLINVRLTIDEKDYLVNDTVQTADVAPYIDVDTSRTMVPVRFVAEALGATVDWDGDTNTVTITKEAKVLEIVVGTNLPNGMGVAVINDGRTFIPIAYVSEQLGASVTWNAESRQVNIYQ